MGAPSDFGGFAFGISPFGGPAFAPDSAGVTATIPAYLYQEYADDDALQAFVSAYNLMAQQYIDWFNMIGLPVYTSPFVVGDLLDLVGNGLYGVPRPIIILSGQVFAGPYNTWMFNTIPFNFSGDVGPAVSEEADDDIYKRTITWNFYKGDGSVFNVLWLKRRVMQFLYGAAGIPFNIDQTYRISVTFGVGSQITIRIVNNDATLVNSALFNSSPFNSVPFNEYAVETVQLPPITNAPILKAGIEQGFLVLPFQFDFVVQIG